MRMTDPCDCGNQVDPWSQIPDWQLHPWERGFEPSGKPVNAVEVTNGRSLRTWDIPLQSGTSIEWGIRKGSNQRKPERPGKARSVTCRGKWEIQRQSGTFA